MADEMEVLFYIGILIPTFITIVVFIGFLLCWYKCNLRELLMSKKSDVKVKEQQVEKITNEKFEIVSQHSADSAIDLGELEANLDETDRNNQNYEHHNDGLVLDAESLTSRGIYYNEVTTTAEINHLRKGAYPSHEKLTDEVHSAVKIYESTDEMQRVVLQAQASRPQHALTASQQKQRNDLIQAAHRQFTRQEQSRAQYHSDSRLPVQISYQTDARRSSDLLDQSSSNYSFGPWYNQSKLGDSRSLLYNSQYNFNSSWRPNILVSCSSNTDNYSTAETSRV